MRFYRPGDDLPCPVGRKHTAEHIPAVLGNHSAVKELQFRVVAADADHSLRTVSGGNELVARLHGQRVNKTVGASVVVGLKALKLSGFLSIRTGDGLTGSVAGETVQSAIHQIGLLPVL